jgi:arginine decarboxylase
VPDDSRPSCTILLAGADAAWLSARAARLAAAEKRAGAAAGFVLDFAEAHSHADAVACALEDGRLQCVLVDAGTLDARPLLAELRRLRPELDVFVAVSADEVGEWAGSELIDRDETRSDTVVRRVRRAIARRASTPFADTLREYVEGARDAWHTPGHSSGDGLRESPWVADFYELMGEHVFNADLSVSVRELDSLLEPSHVIQRAQELAAETFGARRTFFVTGGTSMANKVVVQHLLGAGGKMLVDQGCHTSIHHAALLFGVDPVYLPAAVNREFGLYGPVARADIFAAIDAHPDARLLVLTSCSYDGFHYDLAPIVERAHAAGIRVLVDEAWYAHGYFHPRLRPSALECGADFVTQSTHKTLSAFSQASMIHVGAEDLDEARFREDLNMHTSTSPQYGLLASLDVARKQMSMEGYQRLSRCLAHAATLREEIGRMKRFRVLELADMLPDGLADDGVRLDPTKLTIAVAPGEGSARSVQRALYEDYAIQVEKVTHNTLSLLLTLGTTRGKVLRLLKALAALDTAPLAAAGRPPILPAPGALRLRPRDAYFGPCDLCLLADASLRPNPAVIGRICADQIVPYPPGIPLLVPGQEITAPAVDFLIDLLRAEPEAEVHGLQRQAAGVAVRVHRNEEAIRRAPSVGQRQAF